MTATRENRLKDSTSPYLLQHRHNPVDWYPWGDEALERAKREDRPIFLSIGYAACHWCHVMERESFENPTIAGFMNERFVNIKVDREERPDLDEIYMTATQAMSGSGGWPMSVFLTPDLEPFFAGTYFPPDARYGRPGFLQLLESVARAWKDQKEDLVRDAQRLAALIRKVSRVEGDGGLLTGDLVSAAVRALLAGFDDRLGGFGGAPKFPNPAAIQLLLRRWKKDEDEDALHAALYTLGCMARGGIHDHLGGGFARYSTDEMWLIPHFEKMLYDNAQLSNAYLAAFLVTREPVIGDVVRTTLDWVLREMRDPDGGFWSSQDADSEGEEGKFFVWTPRSIESTLGAEDGKIFCKVYGVTERGNFEHGTSVLHLKRSIEDWAKELAIPDLASRLAAMRKKLFEVRERRIHPGTDDKVLADWNGFMIDAMARAGAALGEPRYVDAARAAGEFFAREMISSDGSLLRAWRRGKKHVPAIQPDHAALAGGLISLYEATFEPRWLELARSLADRMIALFWDDEGAGFWVTEAGAKDVIARTKSSHDGATPSGNSLAVHALERLHRLGAGEGYGDKAARTLRLFRESMERGAPAYLHMIGALFDHLAGPPEVAIVGPANDARTRALLATARERFLPGAVVALLDPTSPDGARAAKAAPLLEGRAPLAGGAPAAHVCRAMSCRLPVGTPDELAKALESP